jgi:hypothetical protein
VDIVGWVLSALAIGWTTFWTIFWTLRGDHFRRPRLKVKLTRSANVVVGPSTGEDSGSIEYTFGVVVINFGGRAITVDDVGLMNAAGNEIVSVANELRLGALVTRHELPHRLEREDAIAWEISGSAALKVRNSGPFVAFARQSVSTEEPQYVTSATSEAVE